MTLTARPRWSHRDPVEGGNPCPEHDPRRAAWKAATSYAKATLKQFDDALDASGSGTASYRVRLVGLAVARFDTWARRGLSLVESASDVDDYEAWLAAYLENWLIYATDTCPHVDVGEDLRARLTEHVAFWTASARAGAS